MIGYSVAHYSGISLPVLEYTVDGSSPRVVGPRFHSTVIVSTSNFFSQVESEISSNLTSREGLPEVLRLRIKRNVIASIQKSPLAELYPIGTEVNVRYNPKKPKMAYVQRPILPSKGLSVLFLLLALALAAGGFAILFGPTITM